MARIRWAGGTYLAKPVNELPNGNWLMEAMEHGPRFTVGTPLLIRANEIIDMDDMGGDALAAKAAASQAAVQAAMDKERETITPLSELLAKAQGKDVKNASET